MMNRNELYERLYRLLAAENNCCPEDFTTVKTTLTTPVLSEKGRKFSREPSFFRLASTGMSTVISADERIHGELEKLISTASEPRRLLEHNCLRQIDKILEPYGRQLTATYHMRLPIGEMTKITHSLKLEWREEGGFSEFYGTGEFPNALNITENPDRPDVLAVMALENGRIIGMAGCSADAPDWWQIGIDVKPEYRSRGIGAALVAELRDEIFRRGKIPYYGTGLSNIHSQRIALKCGFLPVWIDLDSEKIPKN